MNNARNRKNKIAFLGGAFCLMIIGLLAVVGFIQYNNEEEYSKKTKALQITGRSYSENVINPNRGGIYDRNKQVLALSATVYNFFIDVREIVREGKDNPEFIPGLVEQLSTLFDIPAEQLNGYLKVDPETGKPVNDTKHLYIAKKIPHKYYVAFEQAKPAKLKYTYHEIDTKRSYLNDNLAAQVIGFMRGDAVWGLERQYNTEMLGEQGRTVRQYDGDNNAVTEQIPPKEGYSLITTLDTTIQNAAQKLVDKAAIEFEALNTCIIVMNPMTGEIYAMAQNPSFNLNDPTNFEYIKNLRLDTEQEALSTEQQLNNLEQIWSNFSISSSFEPGSIFKPIVVAAALEENIISPLSKYYCGGVRNILGTDIPCHNVNGHGSQTLTEVLANSCNVGMMDIIKEVGRETFFNYRNDFGYGEKTGIDLPGEASVGSSSVLYTLQALNPVELATSSMGQGFNNTAIQAITSFSAIINGGNLMKPYLVSQVVDKDNNVIKENKPVVQRKVISKETSDWMRTALQSVMTPQGTGRRAVIEGYSIGGKTGTAQQFKREDNLHTASIVAYLPAENPEIIALATIHLPKTFIEGVTSASPMMRELLMEIIKYKNIKPTGTVSDKDNFMFEKDSVPLQDFTGRSVIEATRELNSLGVDYEFVGSGNVVRYHMPVAGSPVSSGSKIYLYIKTDGDSPELTQIPNVTGLGVEQAKEALIKTNLVPVIFEDKPEGEGEVSSAEPVTFSMDGLTSSQVQASAVPTDSGSLVVYEQQPSSEIKVTPGTEIKLKVRS